MRRVQPAATHQAWRNASIIFMVHCGDGQSDPTIADRVYMRTGWRPADNPRIKEVIDRVEKIRDSRSLLGSDRLTMMEFLNPKFNQNEGYGDHGRDEVVPAPRPVQVGVVPAPRPVRIGVVPASRSIEVGVVPAHSPARIPVLPAPHTSDVSEGQPLTSTSAGSSVRFTPYSHPLAKIMNLRTLPRQ
ncbi:hypothetical protein PV327_001667 [Microctonus hyperodae]|uniref:Uncharacterized protein n=1 Tax=Microctonus hyperodae TaxID=165561 RepID=A0AA39FDZ2_MICHY|nr:hypothetical protein PV327_001667 [Microctonus hyperodae]